MNRRKALGAMIGAAVSFVLPAPRPRICLTDWCARWNVSHKYDIKLPWERDDFTYATDGYSCVRVRPESGDRQHHEGKAPSFGGLPWNHDCLRGWRSLPRLTPFLARDSQCPVCQGSGYEGRDLSHECPDCDGMGRVWVGSGYVSSTPKMCKRCQGQGIVPPPGVARCPNCKGEPYGTFPSVVLLDGRYFAADLYERAWLLGGEFVHDDYNCIPVYPMIKFRFDGGLGMVLGMDFDVENRLVKA